jgi:large subunit ribosomal protein L24
MAAKIKKGDHVLVLAGKDKGQTGEVTSCPKSSLGSWLIVSGINLVKKHVKPNPERGIQGGVIEKEMRIHISNVALFSMDAVSKKPKASRVGFKTLENGKKVRYLKTTDQIIDI